MAEEGIATGSGHWKPKEFKLNCGHHIYFKRGHAPFPGDTLFCQRCDDFVQFGERPVDGRFKNYDQTKVLEH